MLGDCPFSYDFPQILDLKTLSEGVGELIRIAWIDTGSPPALSEIEIVVREANPCSREFSYLFRCTVRESLGDPVFEALDGSSTILLFIPRTRLPPTQLLALDAVISHSAQKSINIVAGRSRHGRSVVLAVCSC